MPSKVHPQDLKILRDLFLKSDRLVQLGDSLTELGGFMKNGKVEGFDETKQLMIGNGSKARESSEKYECILELGNRLKTDHVYQRRMRYITVNGHIRWVYPKGGLRKALKFYHASTLRAKALKAGLNVLGALGLDRWVSEALTVHTDEKNCFQKGPTEMEFEAFTVFMGTPGIERSVLIGMYTQGVCTHFMKVGVTPVSRKSLTNEGNFLHKVQQKKWSHIETPELLGRNDQAIVFSRLKAKNTSETHQFTGLHAKAFLEITNASRSLQRFGTSTFGEHIIDNCAFIERNCKNKSSLEKSLLAGAKQIPRDLHFSAALAHGDFTPWNMFASKNKIQLYDWEAAMHYAPLLYDLVHYHFQTGIFLKKWKFNKIYSQIKFAVESNEEIRNMVQRYSIDLKMHVLLYLMHVISKKCVQNLLKKERLDDALKRRNKVWIDAMRYLSPSTSDQRTSFIVDVKQYLEGVQHAFLKFDCKTLEALPKGSDLDIAIDRKAVKSFVQYCKNTVSVRRVRVMRKSFMSTVELFFEDNQYLSIDLVYDFKRRSTRFMEISELLQHRRRNRSGIWVPALRHDVEYALMFYTLNGADMPVKYLEFFTRQSIVDQAKTVQYFRQKYDLKFSNLGSLMSATAFCRYAFQEHLIEQKQKFPTLQIKLKTNYVLDTIKDRWFRRGFIVTFSGVDGVGKTTIIENVSEQLQMKYRKDVVLLRHRPKIFPMLSSLKHGSIQKAEQRSDSDNPNHVTEKSKMSSYLRFSYYYLDYFLGQFYVHFRYVMRGKVVIYDRYYFDLINHPERNNFVVNKRLVKWLYRPIMKPALNIYLNAAPEEIYKRKRELEIDEIDALSNQYVQLFSEFSKQKDTPRYVIHRNDEVSKTVEAILYDVQQIA